MTAHNPRSMAVLLIVTILCLQQLRPGNAAEVMFRRADNIVFESDLPVQFELLLQPSELIEDDITVHIITISNTAVGNTDYNSSPINVTFPIEDTSYRAFFEISIYNDNLVEGNETFSLVIDNSSLPEGVSLGWPRQLSITITEGSETPFILATIIDDGVRNEQVLLPSGGIYLWPAEPVQRIVFECISTEGQGQINLTSMNQTSITSQISFNMFPTSLNGFLVCNSYTSEEEQSVYIANATAAGGIAVPLTPSPLTVIEGESTILTYLIALMDRSLNVSSSIVVEHLYDGELLIVINELGNDRYDILFPPVSYEVSIDIVYNRTRISTNPIILDVQSLEVADAIMIPQDQSIYVDQNAYFNCLLNGSHGRLIPALWNVQMIDSPSVAVTMNTTEYLLLPPANSRLVVVRPFGSLTVVCNGGTTGIRYTAELSVQSLPRNCSVDNRNCEEGCGTPPEDGSYCRCPENQTLIETSCVSQSTYFSIYGEVYEDSDIFIHHPLYHIGPFEIICNSQDENAITEQGQWVIQAFNSSTTITFNGSTVVLNNSSISASAMLRGEEPFRQAMLTVDQPIEGYFTCTVNNSNSHTIRVITGGRPLLEFMTQEPVYVTNSRLTVMTRGFVVNSFGKTIQASQSHFAVIVVEVGGNSVQSYNAETGELVSLFPRINLQTEFNINNRLVEISLTSAGNIDASTFISPIYAEIINVTSNSSQDVVVQGELILTCFTNPSDVPVSWIHCPDFESSGKQLMNDPRAIIQSTDYGSALTLRNTTTDDTGEYKCALVDSFSEEYESTFITIIHDTVSFAIEYITSKEREENDFPVQGGLYVIQETPDARIYDLHLLCYNLESNNFNDTEITFANPNVDFNELPYQNFSNYISIPFERFTPSFNGNVTCRSRTAGKESTVYIANATISGAYVLPITQSPIYAIRGTTVSFTYRIGLTNNSLDVIFNVRAVISIDTASPPLLIHRGNNFYDVEIPNVPRTMDLHLEYNGRRVSSYATIYVQDILIRPNPAEYAVGREGEDIIISCVPDIADTVMQWQRDSVPITADGLKYTFAPPDMHHTLTIHNAATSDSGRYICMPSTFNTTTVGIQVFVINEPLAFLSNGVQLPEQAIYNLAFPEPINLICAGTDESDKLQIETNHGDLPLPLNTGLHYTTGGMEIFVSEFENAIEIMININADTEGFRITEFVEFSCISQQSNATVTFSIIPEEYAVISTELRMRVAYLNPLVLQYVVAVNSNGTHSQLDALADYWVEFFPFSEERHVYNSSSIELVSGNMFQLTIPQVNMSHTGIYTFNANFGDGMVVQDSTEVTVVLPLTTINGSHPNILIGQTVELFCQISLPEFVTVSDNLNYTIHWFQGPGLVHQSTAVGSLVHTFMIANASLSDGGEYACAVDVSEPVNSFHLSVFSDPVNIGYTSTSIIPDGNVINFNFNQFEPRRRRRQIVPFTTLVLTCYVTKDHENAIWEIPNNSSFNPALAVMSQYQSVLYFNNSVPHNSVETFVCRSSNNNDFNSSVIITNNEFYIAPLSSNRFVIKYFQPLSLSFQVAVASDGIRNGVNSIFFDQPGSSEPSVIFSIATSSQVFVEDLGVAGSSTAGNYTASFMYGDFYENSTVEVIVEIPDLVTTQSLIHVLLGENVTVECIPSDSSLELQWLVTTRNEEEIRIPSPENIEGSAGIDGNSNYDDEDLTQLDSDLERRLQYQLPLVYQVTLINAAMTDSGYFICSIVPPPNDKVLNNQQEITLNVLANTIGIGYSFDEVIPKNNVINLEEINSQPRFSRGAVRRISCFTTRGHENPAWVISNNSFSTNPLFNETNIVELGGGEVTITIDRFSLYQSYIHIDANSAEFTANLTCQSQSNPATQYTVIITTSDMYFQPLQPNPLVTRYNQPVNLMFLVAVRSDGIFNSVSDESMAAFHYHRNGIPGGRFIVSRLENSSQVFILELGNVGTSRTGNYTILSSEGEVGTIQVIVEVPTLETPSSNIAVVSGETVTLQCIPSDPELELYWTYEIRHGFGTVTVNNISQSRFLSGSSLLHQLILPNTTISDTGNYNCVVPGPPEDSVTISETLSLSVLPDVINIGYSPDLLIPAGNAINLNEAFIELSCFTTQGYENPTWIISSNDVTVTLQNDQNTTIGENVTITVERVSIYQSNIYIEVIIDTEFTGSLICQSENDFTVQSELVLTTSNSYFQPLSLNPLVKRRNQPFNLTFLMAIRSNGISNDVSDDLSVFCYDPQLNPCGLFMPSRFGASSQVFILEIKNVTTSNEGNYIVFSSEGEVGTMQVILESNANLTAVHSNKFENLSGETVVFECMPSPPNIELFWTYQTNNGYGSVTIDTISQSRFLSESSLFHQLILPIATAGDTGNYSCVVRALPGINISRTIKVTISPACGRLDRLSNGVLWPITKAGRVAEMFCSNVNPSFGFGPYATRRCREGETWSAVDTSQCSIRPMQESTFVVYSTFVEERHINNSDQLSQLRGLFANSSMISTELTILSERLYAQVNIDSNDEGQLQKKRQTTPTRYLLLAPVVYTVNILNRTMSIENVTEEIRSVNDSAERSEIIGYNAVDVCECVSNSGDLQQSSMVNICIGTSLSPCICDTQGCRCNTEGYTGNGILCARDSDRDSFPDVELNCSSPTCLEDQCPHIATTDGQDNSSCQPLPNATAGCSQEIDSYYGINWPSVNINTDATNNCPDGAGTAVRTCNSTGHWRMPVVINCSSYEYTSLMTIMEQVNNSNVELSELTSRLVLVSNKSDEDTSSYPADLMNSNLLLEFSLEYIERNPSVLNSDETVQNIADCFSNLLSPENNAGWMELEESSPGQSQMVLMNSERFGLLIANNLEDGSVEVVVSDNIVIAAELQTADNISDVIFPGPNIDFNTSNSIFIPASYIQERAMTTGYDRIPIVSIAYDNIHDILPSVNNEPRSSVISSQVTNISSSSTEFAVILEFEYSQDNDTSELPLCGYWNFSRGNWDTEGVTVVSIDINSSTITCTSTHLTSFAVLVDVSGGHQEISEEESTALSIVSYIGCAISILCLFIVIVVLCVFRTTLLKGIHNFIHLNLAVALILALIVFVSGIETATEHEEACTVVAALLHYFFTAVFTWMLCEGIMLYFLLVKVFNTGVGQREWFYLIIGWGIPFPIVAISVGVAHDEYGHEDFCWIDTEKGAIWGFVAPMLAIIFVNIIFLFLSLYSLYKSKTGNMTVEEVSQITIVKTILKATVILLPLLGITWVFGILAVNQESSVFAWIFALLNSLQGMFILVFHVIRNEKIWHKISSFWEDNKYSSFIPSSQRSSTASRGARIKKSIQTDSTNPPSYDAELKSKLDTSNFPESSGIDTTSKSFNSVVEVENEKPPISDSDVKLAEEEAVTTTTFSSDVKVPSNEETNL